MKQIKRPRINRAFSEMCTDVRRLAKTGLGAIADTIFKRGIHQPVYHIGGKAGATNEN